MGQENEEGVAVLPIHHHQPLLAHHLFQRAAEEGDGEDRRERQLHHHQQHQRKRSRSPSRSNSPGPVDGPRQQLQGHEEEGQAHSSGSTKKPHDGAAATAAARSKKAKPTVALSFAEEEEEAAEGNGEVAHVKRGLEEVTTARLREEERAQRKAAKEAPTVVLGVGGGEGAKKSLQVVDDEAADGLGMDAADGAGGAEELLLLPPPVCVAQAVGNKGPKAAMEDRHTILSLGGGAALVEEAVPVTFVGVYDGHCGAMAAEVAAAELHTFLEPHKELLVGGVGVGGGKEGEGEKEEEGRVARVVEVMKRAYADTEASLLARLRREGNRQDGAAAVTAVVAGRHLYVANVGDCRAVVGTQAADGGGIRATRLSIDHKPNLPEEKRRVQRAGGSVQLSGVWRVAHEAVPMRLAVSRALGDPAFKRRDHRTTQSFSVGRSWTMGDDGSMTTRRDGEKEDGEEGKGEEEEAGGESLVSPVPSVRCWELGADDLVIVLASDGVFDALTDAEVVRMAVEAIRRHPSHPPTAHPLRRGLFRPTEMGVKEAADVLVSTALMRGSFDNCTAAVIALQHSSHGASSRQ